MVPSSIMTLHNQIMDEMEQAYADNDYEAYHKQLVRLKSMKLSNLSKEDIDSLVENRRITEEHKRKQEEERKFEMSLDQFESHLRRMYGPSMNDRIHQIIKQDRERHRQEIAAMETERKIGREVERKRLADWEDQRKSFYAQSVRCARRRAGQVSGQKRREKLWPEVERLYRRLKLPPAQRAERIATLLKTSTRTIRHIIRGLNLREKYGNEQRKTVFNLHATFQTMPHDKNQASPITDEEASI